ncbi:MAG: hypothetical protein OXE86_19055 [Alphaproteobacteria bacterium]|nr:hypothetical protein [Alphaproteobacteria bacterium]
MSFETQILDLAGGPVDLTGVSAFNIGPARTGLFVQNAGDAALRYREVTAKPALTDAGHPLAPGEGIVIDLVDSVHAWIWAPGGTGTVAVSPAT